MTTALYRRYRPETFAEVIGQDHVTGPLRQALRSGQINHAYLFSGPRGCGKTTSARILARCLNCAEGPTDTPCGVCESCVELARGGPGSLDVVEIDAASHGGVDDARDLRERATFAPARDRFKVFILDEAHMVSPQGFNALLKIVEEPPEHVKFIFATTEPDKVIGTIRSRTHHYPFRLVPPDVLTGHLDELCRTEGVTVGGGVLPLVVRAGAGSVRDSLSVLDQLIAGSGESGLDYEQAVALLGYTHASLLDDLVEAVAANDGGSAFRVVERVISTGHEPRRFVEDLLERLRDLIVISASGDAATTALRDVPEDQLERMRAQAGHLGTTELSRSADLVNATLTEMTGATSPRLHLELMIARLLLPAVDDTTAGFGARLDRLERGVRPSAAPAGAPATGPAPSVASATPAAPRVPERAPAPAPTPEPAAPATAEPATAPAAPADTAPEPPTARPAASRASAPAPSAPEPSEPASAPAAPAPTAAARAPEAPAASAGSADSEVLRRRWPEVLATLGRLSRATWSLVSQSAQVADLSSTTLTLSFPSPGLVQNFRSAARAEQVQQAVRETLGFDVRVEAILAEAGAAAGTGTGAPAGPPAAAPTTGQVRAVDPAAAAASWDDPGSAPADDDPGEPDDLAPVDPAALSDRQDRPRDLTAEPAPDAGGTPAPSAPGRSPSPREAGARAHAATAGRSAGPAVPDDPAPDDPDLASSGLTGAPLVAQLLGGTVIDEQLDES